MPKPGFTTTEFWLTVVTDGIAVAALLHPGFKLPDPVIQVVASAAAAVATAVYTWSRGSVKNTVINAAAGVKK